MALPQDVRDRLANLLGGKAVEPTAPTHHYTRDDIDHAKQAALEMHETYMGNLEAIKADSDLTPEAKQRRMAKAYTEHAAKVQTIKYGVDQSIAENRKRAQTELWGITDLTAGKDAATAAQLMANYRSALDQAESMDVTEPGAARALLARANQTGDELLARAIARKAAENAASGVGMEQWSVVADEYLADRPGKAEAAQRASTGLVGVDEAFFSVAKPHDLGRMTDAAVERLAGEA